MKTAFIFPGQGSQKPGMCLDIANVYPEARATFEEADRVLDMPLSRLCFEGPEDDLKLTENTQPAILATSIAVCRVFEERGIRPDFVAGHSLGEYSALVAAGSLRFEDALRIVRRRGRYMQEAVPVGVGAMAALLGLDHREADPVCGEAAQGEIVSPANINSPNQVVIAGHRGAVQRAVELSRTRGARKSVLLPVSAPFHCALLRPAEERLAVDLDAARFSDLRIPLVSNVDAAVVRTGDDARSGLKRQVSRPVRWLETVELLLAQGVRSFVEIGPGKVLIGLVRAVDKSVETSRTEDAKSLDEALQSFALNRSAAVC